MNIGNNDDVSLETLIRQRICEIENSKKESQTLKAAVSTLFLMFEKKLSLLSQRDTFLDYKIKELGLYMESPESNINFKIVLDLFKNIIEKSCLASQDKMQLQRMVEDLSGRTIVLTKEKGESESLKDILAKSLSYKTAKNAEGDLLRIKEFIDCSLSVIYSKDKKNNSKIEKFFELVNNAKNDDILTSFNLASTDTSTVDLLAKSQNLQNQLINFLIESFNFFEDMISRKRPESIPEDELLIPKTYDSIIKKLEEKVRNDFMSIKACYYDLNSVTMELVGEYEKEQNLKAHSKHSSSPLNAATFEKVDIVKGKSIIMQDAIDSYTVLYERAPSMAFDGMRSEINTLLSFNPKNNNENENNDENENEKNSSNKENNTNNYSSSTSSIEKTEKTEKTSTKSKGKSYSSSTKSSRKKKETKGSSKDSAKIKKSGKTVKSEQEKEIERLKVDNELLARHYQQKTKMIEDLYLQAVRSKEGEAASGCNRKKNSKETPMSAPIVPSKMFKVYNLTKIGNPETVIA